MNSFGEIRTCLVLVFTTLLIIKTRARFIYHPDPVLHCLQAKVPCSGHPSEDSCKDYCVSNGFPYGSCSDSCCLCYAGMPPPQLAFSKLFPSAPSPKIVEIESSNLKTEKPKRHIVPGENLLDNEIESSICLTPGCVKAANNILVNMDENIDPCDDFYEFSCGNFEKNTVVPDDKPGVSLIGSLTDKLHQQIRVMLEEPRDNKGDEKKSVQLVRNLYDSCINIAGLESQGIKPLESVLETLGGWPVVEGEKWTNSQQSDWTWTDSVLNLKQVGISAGYFLNVGVGPDLKNQGRRIITIGEPTLGFGREQLANPVFMGAYEKYQIDLAVLLGAEVNSAIQEMNSVLQFERALANISLPRELARGHPLRFYNPMSISELQSKFPSVHWLQFIQKSLPESLEIKSDEVISVSNPEHLQHLLKLLETTDKRVLANYVLWRAASSVVTYMSESVRRVQLEFGGKVTGQLQKPPKWRECVGLVTSTLAHAAGSMFVQKYFNEDSRTEAVKMFGDIHSAFTSLLNEADWMDPLTKRKAFEKAKAMKSHTGYPKELLEESSLLNLYDGLELSGDNFFENVLNITKSGTKYSLNKLRKPIDPNDWVSRGKPAVVNAFYTPMQNAIQFPAGILQGHFFNNDRPHFMNFGAIGWVYGHELIHGFDDQGSRFDLNGDLKDWWHPATKEHYHGKTQCIVEQYGQFSFTDLVTNISIPLNGVISQGENIADNGGIKLAYRGYQSWLLRNGQEKKLPGLKYTPNQLFWISAANNWCSKHRPEAMINTIKTGVHPPGKFRVLGSFQNSKQFARDFQCPLGSKMNPTKKCTVW